MDKETLSNYGWIVICVLVLSVMIALATPFGTFVSNAVQNTTEGLFKTEQNALEKGLKASGIELEDAIFSDVNAVGGSNNATNTLPAKGKTLAEYTWSEVQQIIQAGAATEYNFKVGDLTRTFTINDNAGKQARIVDINGNKVTFMLTSSIGSHNMNAASADYQWGDNIGGYADSEMKAWLDGEVYSGLDADLKAVISPTIITCADGYNNPNGTKSATCYLFLPSIKEVGFNDYMSSWYSYMTAIEAEGETFDWFAEGGYIDDYFWLRSPCSDLVYRFFVYGCDAYGDSVAGSSYPVSPAFVIG